MHLARMVKGLEKIRSFLDLQRYKGLLFKHISHPIELRAHRVQVSDPSSSSVQSSQQPENSSKPGRWHYIRPVLRKLWLWEFVGCIFSLACLTSIVGVLIREDRQRLDRWRLIIPPNAVVSFIAALAKSSMVMVLSQVLSQLKWVSFEDPQHLRQLKRLDSASRGPLGSFILLWTSRRFTASIAAFLMLLTLLIDPFVQIVFSFPTELIVDPNQQSSFSKSSLFNPLGGGNTYSPLPEQMINGVNNGLISTDLQESFICPSGNCLWPEDIKTLGVCGSCNDVTTELQMQQCITKPWSTGHWGRIVDEITCDFKFPSGQVLQANGTISKMLHTQDPTRDRTSFQLTTKWNSTISHRNHAVRLNSSMLLNSALAKQRLWAFDGSVTAFDVLHYPKAMQASMTDDGAKFPHPQGYKCELYWCEKTFRNVQVVGGNLSYNSTNQRLWWISNTAIDLFLYFFLPSEPSVLQTSETLMSLPYQAFEYGRLRSYLETNVLSFSYGVWGLLGPSQSLLMLSPDVNATIVKLGESLTEMIRTGRDSTKVLGQTKVPVTFVRVRWEWLALPLALLLATSTLLAVVAFETHFTKTAIWKEDPLALLFHRIEGIEPSLLSSTIHTGPADIENLADEITVRLSADTPFTFSISASRMAGTRPSRDLITL